MSWKWAETLGDPYPWNNCQKVRVRHINKKIHIYVFQELELMGLYMLTEIIRPFHSRMRNFVWFSQTFIMMKAKMNYNWKQLITFVTIKTQKRLEIRLEISSPVCFTLSQSLSQVVLSYSPSSFTSSSMISGRISLESSHWDFSSMYSLPISQLESSTVWATVIPN